jgi:hypothetical protein
MFGSTGRLSSRSFLIAAQITLLSRSIFPDPPALCVEGFVEPGVHLREQADASRSGLAR